MNDAFDELAKALAEDVSRREALRRVGGVLATALLASVGLKTAWGACPPGKTPCGRKCVNLQTDDKNCGSCGTVCSRGQSCVNGTCTSGGGGSGGGCPSGQTRCSGKCVNLQTDPNNCGSCGNVCSSGQACCSGACAQLGTIDNCSACGSTCTSGTLCISGQCQCPTGQAACNGACVDTASDPNNCGACGNTCAGDARCVSGVCQSGACSPACPSGSICSSTGTCCVPNGGTELPGISCCSASAVCDSNGTCTCVCRPDQYSCSIDEQCCIGSCINGTCCKGPGYPCELVDGGVVVGHCCSLTCVPGPSGAPVCA